MKLTDTNLPFWLGLLSLPEIIELRCEIMTEAVLKFQATMV